MIDAQSSECIGRVFQPRFIIHALVVLETLYTE